MVNLPRICFAAPASGAGKTTVATGVMAALRARGHRVSGHKVGPDYIDPTYHALATGRPGRNLDPFLVGEALIAPLLAHGAAGTDLAVLEGVLGLFDGRAGTDEASTAHVARLTSTPVVLVIDASGAARSVAALVHGFATFDPRVHVAGVLLNRVGSARHETVLREALAGVPVFGALPRSDAVHAPSRHLGLVPVPERPAAAAAALDRLAALVETHCDLTGLATLAASAPQLDTQPWQPPARPASRRPVVALATGAAFSFGYPETAELLAAAGADVVSFDPLRDERLPDGSAALVVGGGFPEAHAGELAGNTRLAAEVRALAARGAPVYAECAGLLWLAESLDGAPMCAVLPARARMGDALVLGYRQATRTDGTPVRAHEFHRSVIDPAHGATPAYLLDGRPEGFRSGRLSASYLHLHWAGHPGLAAELVGAA